MTGRMSRRNWIILAIVFSIILLMVTLTFFASSVLERKKQYEMLTLDEGWVVTRNGQTLEGTSLSAVSLGAVQNGEFIELSTVLPEKDITSAALQITIKQAVTELFLDGELFYEYGGDLRSQGRMLKRGFLTVTLPHDWQGKTLTMRLLVAEPQAFSSLDPVVLANEQDIYTDFLESRRLQLLLGVFLIVYSVFQFLWLPFLFYKGGGAILNPLYSALITLDLGVYILGNYDLLDILTNIDNASTIGEYAAMYMIPGLFAAYLGLLQADRTKQICNICAILNTIMVAAVFLLHAMGLVHLTLFRPAFYIATFLQSILFFVAMRRGLRRLQRTRSEELDVLTDYAIFFGFFVFVVCAFIDVFLYLFLQMIGAASQNGASFMLFGSMIFTITLTAQFFLHGVSHLRADVTRGRLEERAYQDPLTGLANRIRCEQRMLELKLEEPFVIISLDLDGLKAVNDSIGHAEGDRMLKGFANALKKCFEGMTLTGRMGGDEFLVILTGSECAVTDAKLRELEHALFNMNMDEPYFHYSVSYGYASNTETHFGKHVRDIYMLADRRMYDMKRKKKQEKEAANE